MKRHLKNLFWLLLLWIAAGISSAHAGDCPNGEVTLDACEASVQPLDQENAARHFNSLTFCVRADQVFYVIASDFDGNSANLLVSTRDDGKTAAYVFYNNGMRFELAPKSEGFKNPNTKLFAIYSDQYKPSSSFQCR